MIGVDYDLFWTLNPKSFKPFVKAFELRMEYDDSRAWKEGLYIRMAIGSVLDKDSPYPKLPLSQKSKVDVDPRVVMNDIKSRFMITAINHNSQRKVDTSE